MIIILWSTYYDKKRGKLFRLIIFADVERVDYGEGFRPCFQGINYWRKDLKSEKS